MDASPKSPKTTQKHCLNHIKSVYLKMKADLRLGNHINAVIRNMKISDGIVTEITQEHVRLNDIVFAYKYLQPIQLTEEILLGLGFCKEDMADLGVHVYIPISEDSDMCLNFSGGTIWLEEHDTGIEYIHQLQNIYHALTGEELTPITK